MYARETLFHAFVNSNIIHSTLILLCICPYVHTLYTYTHPTNTYTIHHLYMHYLYALYFTLHCTLLYRYASYTFTMHYTIHYTQILYCTLYTIDILQVNTSSTTSKVRGVQPPVLNSEEVEVEGIHIPSLH